MEYVYAALILHENEEEINEDNLTAVLEAANVDVDESRVKALVAALEDVDIEDALEQTAAVPAGGAPASTGGTAESAEPAGDDDDGGDEAAEADDAAEPEADEEDEDVSGEGLGDLFG